MRQERQSAQDYFRTLLQTVAGQAFAAAGYHLENAPMQWAGGKMRYTKRLEDGSCAAIVFQALVTTDTAWSMGAPSRFRVELARSRDGQAIVPRSLSKLVVDDFGVKILPSADHWWAYSDTDSLGNALAEAGHLVVGYGMPWLEGELAPPGETEAQSER